MVNSLRLAIRHLAQDCRFWENLPAYQFSQKSLAWLRQFCVVRFRSKSPTTFENSAPCVGCRSFVAYWGLAIWVGRKGIYPRFHFIMRGVQSCCLVMVVGFYRLIDKLSEHRLFDTLLNDSFFFVGGHHFQHHTPLPCDLHRLYKCHISHFAKILLGFSCGKCQHF